MFFMARNILAGSIMIGRWVKRDTGSIRGSNPRSFFYCVFVLYFLFFLPGHLCAQDKKTVLVLHSYHPNFRWTEQIQAGIDHVLREKGDVELFIHYLDVRRFRSEDYIRSLPEVLGNKYGGWHFDGIITSDDFAMQFVLENRERLFKNVPLFFCGVNEKTKSALASYPRVSGVLEEPDLQATADLAMTLFPTTSRVFLIHNNKINDRANADAIKSALPSHLTVLEFKEPSTREILSALRKFKQEDLVFILSLPDGWRVNNKSEHPSVRFCEAPIFTIFDTFMGNGILGGRTIDGEKQGEIVADFVWDYFKEPETYAYPILPNSPNSYIFDYIQMRKFGLTRFDLPAGTQFLFRPDGFYDRHKRAIWVLGIFFVLETLLIIALVVNLRKRYQSESALRESEERFDLTLNSINEGLWDFNPLTRTFNYISSKWFTMLGYAPDELPHTYETLVSLFHPDDFEEAQRKARHFLTCNIPMNMEFRMRTKDQQYRWILARGEVVEWDGEGRPTRMVGTHIDITERKNLEEQLRQSQKMESVGFLAGGIAHDFNNLLTVILGYTDMSMRRLDEGSPLAGALREIHKAGTRATQLIQQLLAFSRKQILKPKVLNLNQLLREIESMLHRLIGENIQYKTIAFPNLWMVKADPIQIEQIMVNIIVNARDAMPHGGELIIQTENVTIDESGSDPEADFIYNQYVMLSIADTGHGMEEEHVAHIFDPFYTTKEQGKGTGLGLSTVYGIVKQSQGHIKVKSEVGKGTCFRIYLPRCRVETTEIRPVEETPVG
ncbi:PAS domain-containing protein [bacterium]|nr:PAS domain-containing protein [bacterium]